MPIMRHGAFVGAFEIYYEVTGRKTAMMALHRNSALQMGGMSSLLLVGIYVLAVRARRLRKEQIRAEKALRDQATLLETTLSAVPTPIFFKDSNGVYLGCNKAFEEHFGLPKEQVVGSTVHDFASGEFASICDAADRELFETGEIKAYEAEFCRSDSSAQNVLFQKAVIRNADDQITGLVGAIVDITKQKKIEQIIEEDRAFLQAIIDGATDPLVVISPDYEVLLMNRAAHSYLPHDGDVPEHLTCHKLSHQSDEPCCGAEHPCPLDEVRRTGKRAVAVHRHRFASGEERIFELDATPLWNDEGTLRAVIEASRDITERVEAEERLKASEERMTHIAHHDSLTGLPNRLLFLDRLVHSMAMSRRSSKQIALLFLDLDRFKNINDSLGHDAGDKLLKVVADRLQDLVRQTDTVARLGGDEFVIILEEFRGAQSVIAVAQKILSALKQGIHVKGTELHVTSSIGIALYPDDAADAEGLMQCADSAMYRAKQQGRNNCQFYTPDLNARTHEMLLLENDLAHALDLDEFFVMYQPQFDLQTDKLVGVEALMRWTHNKRGLVSPADFIPLAEDTGQIIPMGEWILKAACTQNKMWQDRGIPPIRVAVNVSVRQFKQPGFVDMVDRVLAETGLDPQWLELEITENVIMENYREAIMILTDLKVRGIHLAIDDFGTGYSSLRYLKNFPITKLKIDQSFVRDLAGDSDVSAIVSSIIDLGHNMRLEVIAEGIETSEQLSLLRGKGCEQGQGYYFSKPKTVAELESYFSECEDSEAQG